jgi:hypothetical protein
VLLLTSLLVSLVLVALVLLLPVSTGLSVLLFNSFGSLAVDRSVGMPPLTSLIVVVKTHSCGSCCR